MSDSSSLVTRETGSEMDYVFNGEQLIRLIHGAGGGMAAGNAALAASLGAQTQTIAAQSVQIKQLLEENVALTKRCAELERASFIERQWADKVSLARESAAREGATHAEMLGIAKVAAAGIVGHLGGGSMTPQLLGMVLGGSSGGGAAPPAPRAPREPQTIEPAREGRAAEGPPERLADAVRMIVERLSPETIDALLEAAEAPNPQIPGNLPTLVGIVQVLSGVLPPEVLAQVRDEVGEKLFNQAFALILAHSP